MSRSVSSPARPCNERTFARSLPAWVGLHGLGSEAGDLRQVAASVGRAGLLLDLPGFGDQAARAAASPRAAVAAVLARLDALGVEAPVWVGCSYGGHVALRAALDHPERVSGLVLVSSGGLDPAPAPELAAYFTLERLAARSLDAVASSLDALVGTPTVSTAAYRARRLAQHVGDHDYAAVAASALGALADDAARWLEAVAVPVELVHGGRDPLVPLGVARAAAARLPDATFTLLPEQGHLPWLEAPRAVAACVRRALRRAHTPESPGGTT